MTARRDIYFQGFAKLLWDELKEFDPYDFDLTAKDSWQILHNGEGFDPLILEEHIKQIIAQRVYDLMQSAFIDIYNAQMHLQGVSVHPNAMLRAVEALTQWPESPDSE